MTRSEMIEEIIDLYRTGVPLKVALADFRDEIKKQAKGDKLNGVCKISNPSNKNSRSI